MKKIGIIAVCVFCFTAGSSFGQGGTLNLSPKENESLSSLKYGVLPDNGEGGANGNWLQIPDSYLQKNIPDTLLKFYQNDMSLPEYRFYYRYDKKPGFPVPESPLPRYYDRGVPYYDRVPSQPNDRRSVPIPGFPGWKVQEIMMKSERS